MSAEPIALASVNEVREGWDVAFYLTTRDDEGGEPILKLSCTAIEADGGALLAACRAAVARYVSRRLADGDGFPTGKGPEPLPPARVLEALRSACGKSRDGCASIEEVTRALGLGYGRANFGQVQARLGALKRRRLARQRKRKEGDRVRLVYRPKP